MGKLGSCREVTSLASNHFGEQRKVHVLACFLHFPSSTSIEHETVLLVDLLSFYLFIQLLFAVPDLQQLFFPMALTWSTQRASSSFLSNDLAPGWKYDVFLSFTGVDTRRGFVSHLDHELCKCQGITTFYDDRELERGTSISPELLSAIKASHTAIVVLSPKYAHSKWCLDELTNIVQCMEARKSILPVFYETNPSDVGNQRASFAEAFTEHEEKFISTEDKKKVTQWRADLKKVSKISGWHSKNFKSERQLIDDIVKCVRRKMQATCTLLDSSEKLGSRAIEAISLRPPKVEEVPQWNCEAFSKMHGLRFLEFDNLIFSSGPKFLPCSSRIINWSFYPSKFLPTSFRPYLLTELNMPNSNLVRLSEGKMDLPKLKYLNLASSKKLINTPDFSGFPNLETLDLSKCKNLVEIHPSVAFLKRLKSLNLRGCESIKSLPSEFEMDSLQYLYLSGSSNVKKIPEFGEQMKNVSVIYLDRTAIEKIPSSIAHLVGLNSLSISDCKNLLNLPRAICNLKSLTYLNVMGCSKLDKLPGDMDHLKDLKCGDTMAEPLVGMKNLEDLFFKCEPDAKAREGWGLLRLLGLGKSRPHPPCWGLVLSSLNRLCSLRMLYLEDCELCEGDIPDDIGCLSFLEDLYLDGNNFVSLPESIRRLSKLKYLGLGRCKSLQELPPLPSNSELYITLHDCTSLKRLTDASKLSSRFTNLYDFDFHCKNCIALVQNEGWINTILSRIPRFVAYYEVRRPDPIKDAPNLVLPGSEIPKWFSNQSVGNSVNVKLPPPSCTDWLGIAFCLVFQDPNQNLANPPTGHVIELLNCNLGIPTGSLLSEHLWVFYLPRKYCHEEQFLFKTYITDVKVPEIQCADFNSVKKCGARLVYKQDLEELNQTLKILKRTHEYSDEQASSASVSASFNDTEQIHKRHCY
ncbi:unnamed protein product [Malus baccata var. baccata]